MSAWKTINKSEQAENIFFRQNTTWRSEQLAELKYKLERANSNTTAEPVKEIKRGQAHYCPTRWRRSAGRCSRRKWNTRFMNVLSVAARRAIKSERGGRQRVMMGRKRRTVKREQRWCYSLQTGRSWLACLWALRSLRSVCFSESLKRTAVFSVTPCECCRTGPAGPNVNRNTYAHAQTHTHKHTWASTGGWRESGESGEAEGTGGPGVYLWRNAACFLRRTFHMQPKTKGCYVLDPLGALNISLHLVLPSSSTFALPLNFLLSSVLHFFADRLHLSVVVSPRNSLSP